MSWWPKSLPDYKWPRDFLSMRMAPSRWLGSIVFHVSHAAGRCARFIHRRKPAFLVIRTDGIGDAILAEPLMASLSRRFPGQELHLWAPEATCDLMRAVPFIHRRLSLPRGFKEGNLSLFRSRTWRARLAYRLGRWNFSTAAYLAHSPEPLGNWLRRHKQTEGALNRFWRLVIASALYSPGDTENQFAAQRAATSASATLALSPGGGPHWGGHELARNARLAAQWGDNISQVIPTVHLDAVAHDSGDHQAYAWRDIGDWLGASAIVGVMPATALPAKRYPPVSWAKTIAGLWQRRHVLCAFLGGPGDEAQIDEITCLLHQTPHLRMARSLDLPAMSALIGSLDGLVSLDTGLAHIALAQNVPATVIIGGSHPGRFFPWPLPRRAAILNHPIACQGCLGRCHLSEPQCVTKIDPESIMVATFTLLDRKIRKPLRAAG